VGGGYSKIVLDGLVGTFTTPPARRRWLNPSPTLMWVRLLTEERRAAASAHSAAPTNGERLRIGEHYSIRLVPG